MMRYINLRFTLHYIRLHYPLPLVQVPSGSVQQFVNEATDRQTDRHTDGRDHYTFRLRYASR